LSGLTCETVVGSFVVVSSFVNLEDLVVVLINFVLVVVVFCVVEIVVLSVVAFVIFVVVALLVVDLAVVVVFCVGKSFKLTMFWHSAMVIFAPESW
jgi:hypothetical protein